MIKEKLLSKEQVCVILKISARTLDHLVHAGRITPIRQGKRVQFKKSELPAAINKYYWTKPTAA
jgi:excisionase family DNA binding protein